MMNIKIYTITALTNYETNIHACLRSKISLVSHHKNQTIRSYDKAMTNKCYDKKRYSTSQITQTY